jgi:8-oxo-dGTP diphosphatase
VTINPRRRRTIPTAEREFLARYDPRLFPPIAVTVDVALLTVQDDALSVLLVQRADHPFKGSWALPGGFAREGEDLDAAAARELTEETGLHFGRADVHLEQLRTYGAPDRDPRMRVVSTAYLALTPDLPLPKAGGDAAAAHFCPIAELAATGGDQLAFDHATIINDAVERARAKLEYTALATAFVDEPFSLSDLRRVYESVWGIELDPANFRRKVLSTPGFVKPAGRRIAPAGGGRPAELYCAGGAIELHPPLMRVSNPSATTGREREPARPTQRGRNQRRPEDGDGRLR